MLQHHQRLFDHHRMAHNDPELQPLALENSSPHDQVLHDLMAAYAPWSSTWIGSMFALVMGASTVMALVWISVKVWHTVSGQ